MNFVAECLRSDAVVSGLAAKELGIRVEHPFCGYILLDRSGNIAGFFILNHYSGNNVALTVACKIPIGIRAARFIAHVSFNELGADRISATTKPTNERALRALEKIGFVREGVQRRFFGDEDGVMFGLLRNEQRLIKVAKT